MRRPAPRQRPLRLARFSLTYPAVYLIVTGVSLMAVPDQTLQLLRSSGDYGTVFPRAGGLLLVGLGLIVVQVIRHKIEMLYPTLVGVRILFLAGFTWFFWLSHDPFFAIVFGVIALGVLLTSVGLILDWRRRR